MKANKSMYMLYVCCMYMLYVCCMCVTYLMSHRMLQNCETAEEMKSLSLSGQQVLQLVEDSPKPVVAAIMGSCLGGGLEVGVALGSNQGLLKLKHTRAKEHS